MRYQQLVEAPLTADELHQQALEQTGHWGHKGAGVLFVCTKTKRVLLNHRSEEVNMPNTYGIYGGAIDPNEDAIVAAAREAYEEAGYKVDPNKLQLIYTYKDKEFRFYNYLYTVDTEFTPMAEPKHRWESQGYGWFELDKLPSNTMEPLKELFRNVTIFK